jgi:glycosyltransferase involved in cell wall biosynthesis
METIRKVAIITKYISRYRLDFFNRLKIMLQEEKIELILIYGQPSKADQQKNDSVEIPWGIKIHNYFLGLGNKELCWQPALKFVKGVDLVIVEQASKLILNYLLLFLKSLKIIKVAFWGHGQTFQKESANNFAEFLKRIMSKKVDWWFAYTEISKKILVDQGYPKEKITVVQNSIDTSSLRKIFLSIRESDVLHKREEIGIKGSHVGLFIGALYKEKRIEFLLQACKLIRQRVPDFEIVFIGSGSDQYLLEKELKTFKWMHLVGSKFDSDKVPYFALSEVLLLPGAVGLAILDSFAMELPIVTTNHPSHGPEICYLVNEVNGIIVEDYENVEKYADSVIHLLLNPVILAKLKNGCIDSTARYSLENMVHNFWIGIGKALSVNNE